MTDATVPARRRILLVQLPIPQPGMEPAEGNVPLAAGYLKLLARLRGLESACEIDILPARDANRLGDRALAAEILARDPWLVGWTCYLWNVERSLDIARLIKQERPEIRILIGGPEITADNQWVLERPEVDFAAIGEGEQTFVELLGELKDRNVPSRPIAGLYVSPALGRTVRGEWSDEPAPRAELPAFRQPLGNLNEISSPYLYGILDAADERMLLLETLRGCVFKCKFCYYPKSYDDLYFVSRERIVANLEHARAAGAREVVLLDPTLNQRRDFDEFLGLLAECNPGRQFKYFGELRAEGIGPRTARLLREANFTEVEIGLQSIDPRAQELMDRRNNLKAFERGVRAMRDEGIQVKVDLIIGLPGDTRDSIRRSFSYLHESGLYDEIQVFNLSVLPGTAFRQEAAARGLDFQSRPPYYVLKTPTLELADLYMLMEEAEALFETEFDPLPAPELSLRQSASFPGPAWERTARPAPPAVHAIGSGLAERRQSLDGSAFPGRAWDGRRQDFAFSAKLQSSYCIDLDLDAEAVGLPQPHERAQAFALWLRAADFRRHAEAAQKAIERLLADNPHTTLQVVLEPGDPRSITLALLADLTRACYRRTTYLDRFYSILPGPMKGSKRLVILLPENMADEPGPDHLDALAEFATLVRRNYSASASPANGAIGRVAEPERSSDAARILPRAQ